MHLRPITDFLDDPFRAAVAHFIGRRWEGAGERIEVRFRRVDGTGLETLLAGSPIVTAEGVFAGTMLHIGDVTAKRDLDAHLVQAQRLEAVGLFASGVAHDFNNLLTAIRGYTELARTALPDGVMPGIHGPELARRIRAIRPDIGVVFTSGFAADGAEARGAILCGAVFLPKPFSVDAIVRAVRDAMEARSPGEAIGDPAEAMGRSRRR